MEHAAAQDQVLRVENIQFCGNCAGNFLQEILQDGGRALFQEQPAYGQAGKICVPQMLFSTMAVPYPAGMGFLES